MFKKYKYLTIIIISIFNVAFFYLAKDSSVLISIDNKIIEFLTLLFVNFSIIIAITVIINFLDFLINYEIHHRY